MGAVPLEMMFDLLCIRLNKNSVADMATSINMKFNDIGTNYALELSNGVLNNSKGRVLQDVDATYKLSTGTFFKLLGRKASFAELLASGKIKVEGNPKAIGAILQNIETFESFKMFNIVTP